MAEQDRGMPDRFDDEAGVPDIHRGGGNLPAIGAAFGVGVTIGYLVGKIRGTFAGKRAARAADAPGEAPSRGRRKWPFLVLGLGLVAGVAALVRWLQGMDQEDWEPIHDFTEPHDEADDEDRGPERITIDDEPATDGGEEELEE